MVSSLHMGISDLRLPCLSEARVAVLIDKIVHLGAGLVAGLRDFRMDYNLMVVIVLTLFFPSSTFIFSIL